MLKFGIVNAADGVSSTPAEFELRRVAATVLEQVGPSPTPAEERLIENIMRQFPAGDYNFLHTYAGRYANVDTDIAAEIKARLSGRAPLRVHEMAVSNGITSLEFFRHLKDILNLKYLATDLYNEAYVVGPVGGSWRVIFDAKRKPVQFVGRHTVISAFQRERKRYPLNGLLQRFLKTFVLPTAERLLSEADRSETPSVRLLRMIHPRCLAEARADPRFTFGRHDITRPAHPPSEVVRLMSVVRALPPEMLPGIFRSVGRSLVDGGLLILGVRDETRTPTTIFERRGARLTPIRDITGEYLHKRMVVETDLDVSS